MTSTIATFGGFLVNSTSTDDILSYTPEDDEHRPPSSFFLFLSKWILRVVCIVIIGLCPWANYKLIQFFQTRPFFKESSVKWFVIFKAAFDTLYMLISIPIIFSLTFAADVIHKNFFTCKSITYLHYLADDLVSMMLTLMCVERMLRITCGCRFRTRFTLIVSMVVTCLFMILNIHHFIRLQHIDGVCQKTYYGIWDYDFDLYYSLAFTSVSWTIIFLASLNLFVSIYYDRLRRRVTGQRQAQQQPKSNIAGVKSISLGSYSDRQELINDTDDFEDSTTLTIEPVSVDQFPADQEKQDNVDLQITIGVLITSAIFLACNLPNFIIFVMRFVLHTRFTSIGFVFVYVSLFPLLVAHTVSYFIFNHLLARCFRNDSS